MVDWLPDHELELTDQTIVVFLSDNGPEGPEGSRFNAGMRGIKLHSAAGIPYADDRYRPVWGLANERRVPVLLHTWGDMGSYEQVIADHPDAPVLLGHAGSANIGEEGDGAILFGLSGTGKTTLSADPQRELIGDDETAWTDEGLSNLEDGCYAKLINLRPDKEPEIWNAVFHQAPYLEHGAIVENCMMYPDGRFDLADVDRGARAYAEAHIPGAIYAHLDRDLSGPLTPETGRHPLPDARRLCRWLGRHGVTPDSQVVAYDDTGGSMAVRIWWLLRWLGHTRVAVLDGGWSAWRSSDHPCATTTPSPVDGGPCRRAQRTRLGSMSSPAATRSRYCARRRWLSLESRRAITFIPGSRE